MIDACLLRNWHFVVDHLSHSHLSIKNQKGTERNVKLLVLWWTHVSTTYVYIEWCTCLIGLIYHILWRFYAIRVRSTTPWHILGALYLSVSTSGCDFYASVNRHPF